jgi:hypothetical protein
MRIHDGEGLKRMGVLGSEKKKVESTYFPNAVLTAVKPREDPALRPESRNAVESTYFLDATLITLKRRKEPERAQSRARISLMLH